MADQKKAPVSPEQARQIVSAALSNIARTNAALNHISIAGTHEDEGITFYEVVIIADNQVRWTITKRFSEFDELNEELEARVRQSHTLPPFPDKQSKAFVDHSDQNFIQTRRSLLQNYVQKINAVSRLRASPVFLDFLNPSAEDCAEAVSVSDDVFTKEQEEKNQYDSQEVTSVRVPAAQILKRDHVVYQVNVENLHKRASYNSWTVLRRFEEFYALDSLLREELKESVEAQQDLNRLIPLPARELKVFVDHLDQRFIEKRRLLLELYLQRLIHLRTCVELQCALEFLGVES